MSYLEEAKKPINMQQLKIVRLRTNLIVSALMVSSTFCFSQQLTKGWADYKSKAFQISYPIKWAIDTSKKQGAEVFLFSPLEDSLDRFRENINVIVQNLEGLGIDLKKYTSISEQQIREMSAEAKIFSSKDSANQRGTFHKIIYSAPANGYKLKFEQYYFVKNAKAYIITFSSELDKFEQYEATAEQILASFKLNQKPL